MSSADLWYDRFFSHEYLRFDEHPHTHLEIDFLIQTLALTTSSTSPVDTVGTRSPLPDKNTE